MRGLVRISTEKAIQRRVSGHSLNCRTLKTEKLLSSSAARKSALISGPRTYFGPIFSFLTLDGQNRQSPIASVQRTRSTLASHSAVPRGTNVKRMNANRAIRIAAQRTQGLRGLISVFSREI